MIIGVNNRTHEAVEVYPNHGFNRMRQYVADLEKHGIGCISMTEETVRVTAYGNEYDIEKDYALVIGHPKGVYSYEVSVLSINELKLNFDEYNGNQLISVVNISNPDIDGLMINPMLIRPQQLYNTLSPYFKYGLKVYGALVNKTVTSIDKIEYGKTKVKLSEPGFMYFVFSDNGGKLIVDGIMQNTFNVEWKLSSANEWLSMNYYAMEMPVVFKKRKSKCNIACHILEPMEERMVEILLRRLGFFNISKEVFYDDEDSFVANWLTVGKNKAVISYAGGSHACGRPYIYLTIKDGIITKRDVRLERAFNDILAGCSEPEDFEYVDEYLGVDVKDKFKNAKLSTFEFKPGHHLTFNCDFIKDDEMIDFLKHEEDHQFRIDEKKPRACDRHPINNIYLKDIDITF